MSAGTGVKLRAKTEYEKYCERLKRQEDELQARAIPAYLSL